MELDEFKQAAPQPQQQGRNLGLQLPRRVHAPLKDMMNMYIHVYIYMYMYIYICIYSMYIDMYMYTHVYVHNERLRT